MTKSFEVTKVVPDTVTANKAGGNAALGIKVFATVENTSEPEILDSYGLSSPLDERSSGNDVDVMLDSLWKAKIDPLRTVPNLPAVATQGASVYTNIINHVKPQLNQARYSDYSDGSFGLYDFGNGVHGVYLPLAQTDGYTGVIGSAKIADEIGGWKNGSYRTDFPDSTKGGVFRYSLHDPNSDFEYQSGFDFLPGYGFHIGSDGRFKVSSDGFRITTRRIAEYDNNLYKSDAYTVISTAEDSAGFLFVLDLNKLYISTPDSVWNSSSLTNVNDFRLYLYGKEPLWNTFISTPDIDFSTSGVSWLDDITSLTVTSGTPVTVSLDINDAALSSINSGNTGPYTLKFSEDTAEAPDVDIPLNLNLIESGPDYEIVKVDSPITVNRDDAGCFTTKVDIKNISTGEIEESYGWVDATYDTNSSDFWKTLNKNWGLDSPSVNDFVGSTNPEYSARDLVEGVTYNPHVFFENNPGVRIALSSNTFGAFSGGELTPVAITSSWYGFGFGTGAMTGVTGNGDDTSSDIDDRGHLATNGAKGIPGKPTGLTGVLFSIYDPNNTLENLSKNLMSDDGRQAGGMTTPAGSIGGTGTIEAVNIEFDVNVFALGTRSATEIVAYTPLCIGKYGDEWVYYAQTSRDDGLICAISGTIDPDIRFRFYDKEPFWYRIGTATDNVTVNTSTVPWLTDSTSPLIRPGETRGLEIPVDPAGIPASPTNSDTDIIQFDLQGGSNTQGASISLSIDDNKARPLECPGITDITISQFEPARWFWAEGDNSSTATTQVTITDRTLGSATGSFGDPYSVGGHQADTPPTNWKDLLLYWLGAELDESQPTIGTIDNGEIVPALIGSNPAFSEDIYGFAVYVKNPDDIEWPTHFEDEAFSVDYATALTVYDPDGVFSSWSTTNDFTVGDSGDVYLSVGDDTTAPSALPSLSTWGWARSFESELHKKYRSLNEYGLVKFNGGDLNFTTTGDGLIVFAIGESKVSNGTRIRTYNRQPRFVSFGAPSSTSVDVAIDTPASWLQLASGQATTINITGGEEIINYEIDATVASGLTAGPPAFSEESTLTYGSINESRTMELLVIEPDETFTVDPNAGLTFTITRNLPASLSPSGDSNHEVNYSTSGIPSLTPSTSTFTSSGGTFKAHAQEVWPAFTDHAEVSSGKFNSLSTSYTGFITASSAGSGLATVIAEFHNVSDVVGDFYFSTGVPEGESQPYVYLHSVDVSGGSGTITYLPDDGSGILETVGDSPDYGKVYKLTKLPSNGAGFKIGYQSTIKTGASLNEYFIKLWDAEPSSITYTIPADPTITIQADESWVTLSTTDGFTIL